MPLDFSQVDAQGVITGLWVPIGIDLHFSLIHHLSSDQFPLLARMHEYYDDVYFARDELEALDREIQAYVQLTSDSAHAIALEAMSRVVRDSIQNGYAVEAIAD